MIKAFFHTVFFEPLYNALVWLANVMPAHDIGWAIITLTVLVKLILFPLYRTSLRTQMKLKELEPELKKLKEEYPDRQVQAQKLMELYAKFQINPFAGIVVIFLQIPIFLALFFVFRGGFSFNPEWIYSFITPPAGLHTVFLGFIDLTQRSILLAVLTGVTQFIQMQLALPPLPKRSASDPVSFKDDLARSMNLQMKYVMPVMIGFISLSFPAAVSLYWLTSNIFGIVTEYFIRRERKALTA